MKKFDNRVESIDDYASEVDDAKDSHNFFQDELQECYKIVEDFIKRNNRILVGGMAIDFALKLKGSFLYSKNKIDYDFISDDYHNDAYKLGNILADKFDNISVICALHASTMRVRYKFMAVADITYVPHALYKKIEFIEFMGFKCIHPHVQMIDQMRSMVYMAENPPRESFFGDRILKDIKRFSMLADKYPIVNGSSVSSAGKVKMHTVRFPHAWLAGNCLGGIPAAAYWAKKLKLGTMNIDINKWIVLTIPVNSKVTIYSDEPDRLTDIVCSAHPASKKVKYRAILDKLPERTEIDLPDYQLEILNCGTSLLLAESVSSSHVIHLYGVLMYLLTNNVFISEQPMLHVYFKTVFQDFTQDVKTLPEKPVFYGKNNWSETYLLATQRQLSGKAMLPKNAYPEKNKHVIHEFNLSESEILNKDGSICP